mgnify:CR=1 FL=1
MACHFGAPGDRAEAYLKRGTIDSEEPIFKALQGTPITIDNAPQDPRIKFPEATAKEEGKPERAMPKIVEGRVNGFVKEHTLLEQASIVESKKSVQKVLSEQGATVTGFVRIEIGA